MSCLWTSAVPSGEQTLVLPDACTDLIWRRGAGAFIAGPDTGPAPAVLSAGTVLVGVRFRPGPAAPRSASRWPSSVTSGWIWPMPWPGSRSSCPVSCRQGPRSAGLST